MRYSVTANTPDEFKAALTAELSRRSERATFDANNGALPKFKRDAAKGRAAAFREFAEWLDTVDVVPSVAPPQEPAAEPQPDEAASAE